MKKVIAERTSENHCWNTVGVWSHVTDKCEKLSEHIHCRNCPVFSDEGRRVLDRAAPVGYLKEWRKSLSADKQSYKTNNQSALVFRIGEEWFALPTQCLHEITEKRSVHRIPRNINTNVSGVVNIGGEVRICYSLENILGVKDPHKYMDDNDEASIGRFIVALMGEHYYVFSVSQVSGLCWYSEDEFFPVPSTLDIEGRNMLSGVITHNKHNVAVFDVDKFQTNLEGIRL